jgi:hypothetical protein
MELVMKIIMIFLIFTNIIYSYSLKLNINPLESNILINNKDYSNQSQKNPLILNLENGEYLVSICKDNYNCYKKKIWIMDNNLELNISLKAIKSTLLINSDNLKSKVFIDDKEVQKGSLIEFNESKTIKIIEKKDFFYDNTMMFKINLGETYRLNLPLLKKVERKLNINGIAQDAIIMLDGKEICRGKCTKNLNSGKYNITILKNDFYPYKKEVEIREKDVTVNYNLIEIPKKMRFGLGLSYLYGRLLGGYPELNIELNFNNKINIKSDLIYVVNFSDNSEYYGVVFGGSYNIYEYKNIFNVYLGVDLIFSRYIDDNINYLQNGIGFNLGGYYKVINSLYINLDITNRLNYIYHNNFYDILGKIGLIYYF